MVRHPRRRLQTQKLPQRKGVGAAPLDPALRIDALEVAHHVHPEVPPRRHRWRPHLRSVEGLAGRFRKRVETGLDQYLLKSIVEYMPRRARHLPPRHHQVALSLPLPPQRHHQVPNQSLTDAWSQSRRTSSTGCYTKTGQIPRYDPGQLPRLLQLVTVRVVFSRIQGMISSRERAEKKPPSLRVGFRCAGKRGVSGGAI
jgi:hypothetical protein